MVTVAARRGSSHRGRRSTVAAARHQIRKRAGLADKKPTSQADFRAAVAQERRVELAFENHRWFDLLRYGTAEATLKAHGTKEKAAKTTVNAASYNTINLLYLYPQRETLLLPK